MFDPLSGGTIETVRAVLMLKRLKAFDWSIRLEFWIKTGRYDWRQTSGQKGGSKSSVDRRG